MSSTDRVFVDVLTLRDGKTLTEAEAYFEKAIPLIERHGLKRLKVIRIDSKMRGHTEVNPSIVQIWQVEKDEPFAGLGSDPAYQAIVPLRDSIFDMPNLQGWFGSQV